MVTQHVVEIEFSIFKNRTLYQYLFHALMISFMMIYGLIISILYAKLKSYYY